MMPLMVCSAYIVDRYEHSCLMDKQNLIQEATEARVDEDESMNKWLQMGVTCLTFLWDTLFRMIVPPTKYLTGTCTFAVSILIITVLTALMGDMAQVIGCALAMDDKTVSLTIVSVGTSLPDLFASRIAARESEWADDAIGNINGSNAFNVFLGLGK